MVVPEMLAPGGPALNAYLLEWCAARLNDPPARFQAGSVGIGIADGSHLLAVVAYDNFRKGRSGQPLNIECSIAADNPRWAARGIIRAILSYPFEQLRVPRVTAMVAEKNMRSRKMLERLGFVTEGRIRACLEGGEDMLITGMLREEANKWLK